MSSLEDRQVDFELTVSRFPKTAAEDRFDKNIVLTTNVVTVSRWFYVSFWRFLHKHQRLSFGVFSKIGSFGSNSREENSVQQLSEDPFVAISSGKNDFFHELTFDLGDGLFTFGIVGLTNHDTLFSR